MDDARRLVRPRVSFGRAALRSARSSRRIRDGWLRSFVGRQWLGCRVSRSFVHWRAHVCLPLDLASDLLDGLADFAAASAIAFLDLAGGALVASLGDEPRVAGAETGLLLDR